MLRFALIFCVAAACGHQPPAPMPGSGSTSAQPGSASGAEPDYAPGTTPHTIAAETCPHEECGPPMRMPNRKCPDGSIAGPTGQCLRKPDGRCAWEVRQCP